MILHPGILALLLGSITSLLMLFYAVWTGILILRSWDFSSSSAHQLALERRTYLVSTLVNFSLSLHIVSVFLFVFTVDDIHSLFVGAMCATGSLNANPIGWYALGTKIIVFFLAGFWIALNHLDQSAEQYPLVKLKYLLLLVLLPILIADLYLMSSYFLGLDPAVITSCCGSLFGAGDENGVSSLTGVPVLPAMFTFFFGSLVFICLLSQSLRNRSTLLVGFTGLAAAIFMLIAIASIISFVSPYVYELPTHHCPFDLLQRQYGYIGYPLYLSLFTGVYFSMLPTIFLPLRNYPGIQTIIAVREKKWLSRGLAGIVLFVVLVTGIILNSNLSYL